MKAKQYLAAFLVAAMAGNPLMTAFAAEESRDGMQLNEDGQWNYYKDGEMVSGEIVKVRYNGANNRYYFDEDGVMARNELFEYEGETMYAYPNGTLAKNGWVLLDEGTGEITTDSEQGRWYYFDSDRHQVKDGKIRLNEKKGTHWYRFEDGDMIKSRWVEESGLDDYEGDPEDGEDWHYYEYYGWEARNKWLYLNDGSGDEAWYEFDSQGRMATDSDAKKAPKDQVEAVELSDGEDDTVEMKVGQEVTVKFDVVLASDSDASLTKNHDFWSEDIDPEFDVEAAVIYNKTEDWSADGTYTITYKPRYPGQVSIKAVIDGRESEAVTFISEWANEETQKAETIGTIIDEHKSDEGDVLGTVQSIREISVSMDSRESLLDGWSEKAGSLETLENDYLIAAGIVKTEEVTDEAQELLRSGGVQIVGAGLNSEDYGELVFTVDKGQDVELEEKDLVGVEGNGFMQAMVNFEVERLIACAQSLGAAECAFEDAVTYATQRIQFGRPIGKNQLIQEHITDMYMKIENMRNWVYRTAWKIDNGMPVQIDSAVAKLYCGRAAFEVIDTTMQVMGGIGYTKDCRISRLWRDQRVYRIGAGTDEIMIHIAGRAIQKQFQE